MKYQNLIDLSLSPSDMMRFPDGWDGVKSYVENLGVDGIELLIGYERPELEIPAGLVKSIHLPFWTTWLDVWRKGEEAAKGYFPGVNPDALESFCGGVAPQYMVDVQRKIWRLASEYNPAYAVLHASHVELEHVFKANYTYTSVEVLEAFAQLLNCSASGSEKGQPPCTLGFENLWWPGLDFLEPSLVDDFAAQLEFDNWIFVLDTGHLMNTNPRLRCEDEAVDYVLGKIDALSKTVQERICSLHLNVSLSGEFQLSNRRRGMPFNWKNLNCQNRYNIARDNVLMIDQHLPFGSERAQEIVDFVNPEYVVHEFITETTEEYSKKLQQQMGVLV